MAEAATLTCGQVTMNGAAVALGGAGVVPGSVCGVWITCHKANTNPIYVGATGVTLATGFEIAPGERQWFAVLNPKKIFVIGTNAEKYSWATVGS